MTGVSECSQQRGSLKDDGYKHKTQYAMMIKLNKKQAKKGFYRLKLSLKLSLKLYTD
ncbi:hypothetical protein [Photorhabdus sp. RM96S]|uniref:hypothetical protein n=1 Tax=Photorhabdus sp. RM96S TaxID=3342822 RepID=UPI0036D9A21D